MLRDERFDKEGDLNTQSVPVIMYHSVQPSQFEWAFQHIVTPLDVFKYQIGALYNSGFKTVFWRDLYEYMKHNIPLPPNSVMLTFDDGYLDNWVYVYPILKRYGFKMTIFVNPEFVDPTDRYRPNIEDIENGTADKDQIEDRGFLSWREMKAMETSGLVDIQSHALTHTWYFKSDEITDFHHPGDCYVWLNWNAQPERKHKYLAEDQENFVPYGTPIYSYGESLAVRRYFPDSTFDQSVVEYVHSHGGKAFFSTTGWRDHLFRVVEEYRRSRPVSGRYETAEEYLNRVRGELADSKQEIECHLGKRVDFICWPCGAYNAEVVELSKELGYVSCTLGSRDSRKKQRNAFGEDPTRIKRIGCASAWYWRGRFISYTDPRFFMANVRYFQGSKIYLCLMRLYKIKYLLHHIGTRA